MKLEEAQGIIEQAIDQAFLKGVYSLQDATFITVALQTLFPKVQLTEIKEH